MQPFLSLFLGASSQRNVDAAMADNDALLFLQRLAGNPPLASLVLTDEQVLAAALLEQQQRLSMFNSLGGGGGSNNMLNVGSFPISTTAILLAQEQQRRQLILAAATVTSKQEHQQQTAGFPSKNNHPFDHMEAVDLPWYVKQHDSHLSFPEKLMLMLMFMERKFANKPTKHAPIHWAMDGKAFCIRGELKEELLGKWLPLFFRMTQKFQSFTRKLYRWGFRQIRSPNGGTDVYFFHPNFCKFDKSLMAEMSSVTAETRRQQEKMEASSSEKNNSEPDETDDPEPVAVPMTLSQYQAKEQQETVQYQASTLNNLQQGVLKSSASDSTTSALFQDPHKMTGGCAAGTGLESALAQQMAMGGAAALLGLESAPAANSSTTQRLLDDAQVSSEFATTRLARARQLVAVLQMQQQQPQAASGAMFI